MIREFTLQFSGDVAPGSEHSTFVWQNKGYSSIDTSLDSNLSQLGPVPAANVDAVRLAVAVFAADRSSPRRSGQRNWGQREIRVSVPVRDPEGWTRQSANLSKLTNFLTGDQWTYVFTHDDAPLPEGQGALFEDPVERVVMLSGGADSAIGVLESLSRLPEGSMHHLFSHYANTSLKPLQQRLAEQASELIPGRTQPHTQIRLSRAARRVDGVKFQDEPSSRSRSFLFLTLALALAASGGCEVWIPENGFASLNPPLGPERRGSLSTRTTHPRFLHELQEVLSSVGAHSAIHNPFQEMTKGEMFTHAAELIGVEQASQYLSATESCAHTDQRFSGKKVSCGECFGCLMRRASFLASGVVDRSDYMVTDTERSRKWLAGVSSRRAMEDFVRRGFGRADVLALGLPPYFPPSRALALCQRGVAELKGLFA